MFLYYDTVSRGVGKDWEDAITDSVIVIIDTRVVPAKLRTEEFYGKTED
jgi:hypothetical protein